MTREIFYNWVPKQYHIKFMPATLSIPNSYLKFLHKVSVMSLVSFSFWNTLYIPSSSDKILLFGNVQE